MTLFDHIESILQAGGSLHQLRTMAIQYLSDGMTRQDLLEALEGVRATLRSQDREADRRCRNGIDGRRRGLLQPAHEDIAETDGCKAMPQTAVCNPHDFVASGTHAG